MVMKMVSMLLHVLMHTSKCGNGEYRDDNSLHRVRSEDLEEDSSCGNENGIILR